MRGQRAGDSRVARVGFRRVRAVLGPKGRRRSRWTGTPWVTPPAPFLPDAGAAQLPTGLTARAASSKLGDPALRSRHIER